MLAQITGTTDVALQNDKANQHSKPVTSHELFCKAGIDPEGLSSLMSRPSPSVVIDKENLQHYIIDSF